MNDALLMGWGRFMLPIPAWVWRRQVRAVAELDFMDETAHRIRNFVVTEIARTAKPLTPESIGDKLGIPSL
jgi:hypothetical protein